MIASNMLISYTKQCIIINLELLKSKITCASARHDWFELSKDCDKKRTKAYYFDIQTFLLDRLLLLDISRQD